jgi:hypothetical protein
MNQTRDTAALLSSMLRARRLSAALGRFAIVSSTHPLGFRLAGSIVTCCTTFNNRLRYRFRYGQFD